jgi:nucleoside-diphosphate-sugar epimerase
VGAEEETSVRELAEMLCRLFPERKCKVVRRERSADDPYIPSIASAGHFDISKIKRLGWEPTTNLEEGFKRTILSYE